MATTAWATQGFEALSRIGEAIRSQGDQTELFRLLTQELRQAVPFDAIIQFDDQANKVQWRMCESPGNVFPAILDGLAAEDTIAQWVYLNQQPVVLTLSADETRFPATRQIMESRGLRSLSAVPLSTAHRRLGSLALASKLPDAYQEDEVRFLSLAAGQIALAIDDARNFQESQRSAERLRLLLDLTNRVVSTLDLRELLREIASSLRRVMHCDGAGVSLPDPETGELRIYALDFPTSKGILHEGLAANDMARSVVKSFETGQAFNLNAEEIRNDGAVSAEGANSLCRLPLISRGKTLGVLSLGTFRENAFSSEDMTFLGQVASQIAIAVENALAYGQIADLKEQLSREKVYLEDEIRSELNFDEIVGKSEGLRRVLSQVETVAPTDSTVLIYGETGTGKELIARAVHDLSSRKANAFVKLNCAAIPIGLLESDLFGHERGAFTGAISQRIGRFELAHRGTVFLDEVGEIALELQPKLLRVLQEREFERLGSTRTIRTDARLIAATNRDLEAMVEQHQFRSDLFYRLNVFPIRIPPLRERTEDIPLLVRHFVQQFSNRNRRGIESIPSATMEALVRYPWPGNIRELQNVIERAVIITKGPVLNVAAADLKIRPETKPRPSPTSPKGDSLRDMLGDQERKQILTALEQSNWIVAGDNGAAARLGMKRSTLQFRMRKLGITISRKGE